jgi:hypothetical protein
VEYSYGNERHTRTVREGKILSLPLGSSLGVCPAPYHNDAARLYTSHHATRSACFFLASPSVAAAGCAECANISRS